MNENFHFRRSSIFDVPTYEYKCTNDGSTFDIWQEVGSPAPPCPTCGAPTKKVFQPPRVIFKGSGFYVTDKRSESGGANQENAAKNDDKTEAAPASSPSETKAESPKTEAKTPKSE